MAENSLIILLCFAGALLTTDAAPAHQDKAEEHCCPNGWVRFDSRCFMFFHSQKTWIDAEKSCLDVGGNLASVRSKEENDFIVNLITQVTGADPRTWIGGHDAVQEGAWLWNDGTKFDFQYWADGDPNNAAPGEHCLMVNFQGDKWYDAPCSWTQAYVCSRDKDD